MSNMSYTFKENSQVKDIQGGEKKVMKKILSVALSTAMAFSMFASVAFGAESLTPQQQFDALKAKGILTGYADGSAHLEKTITRAELAKVIVSTLSLKPIEGVYSFNDKNYKKDAKWPAPYIEAVATAGIMEGKDKTKKIFDFNGNVTVEELATVLVRALKLEVPTTGIDNSATKWAQGYVQAAINAGYIQKGINYQAAATRSQVVVAAYTIDQQRSIPTVASYKVVDANNVEFTLSNQEVVKVKLDKALEANKETAVEFKDSKGNTIATKVTWVVTSATKVDAVTADNLKEVVVKFNGEVDKATAELKDNYKLSNSLEVKSAVLNDAKNAVTLTVKTNLNNQQKYTLNVTGVKAGTSTISATNYEFTPVDNKLPEVVSVTGLGTKAVKVVFSEPVKQTLAGTFQIDGKGFYGEPKVEGRQMVLVAADSSILTVGEHTLTVSGVEDFAGFKSLKSEHKFTVAEDTTAPTIQDATATLEKLTVTFSEDIDPDTLNVSNVYHKRGDSKVSPTSFTALSGNKYEFYFDKDKALPSYATTINVEGVKDYSGNQIKETTKVVTPTIDTERPTVVDVRVDATNKARLAITFNKPILADQNFANLITVTDKDGKVRPISNATVQDGNKLIVDFYSVLPEGTNTVSIKGIKDNTLLGNVIQDYSTTVNVGDNTAPKFAGASFNISDSIRRAVIVFNEKMDPATLVNRANYILTINGASVALPDNASFTVIQDSKAVVIDLPSEINGTTIDSSSWTDISIRGLRDVAGNYVDPLSKNISIAAYSNIQVASDYSDVYQGSLTGKKTLKVKLNQAVSGTVNAATVKVNGVQAASVTTNNTDVITIGLNNDTWDSSKVSVDFAGTTFTGVSGNKLTLGSTATPVTANNFNDEVKPEVAANQNVYATTVTNSTYTAKVYVTEDLKATPGLVGLYASDLVVTRLSDTKKVPSVATPNDLTDFSYTVEVVNTSNTEARPYLKVTIKDASGAANLYSIEVKSDARYIQDVKGNVITAKGAQNTVISAN
ncbi:Ig-like domain-containing protein [Paenibacillus sp. J22TS3]|uniref:Ig-like domain-containing protein n=1 Tax=Paenibacillus sp. J22TS3 TaxID=2807192 RepID=UPI001B10C352|nr:Ig-like domain-containing protein [Paenibacillus sp. J22TS3]GIP21779.1 hypothetical protein J22TS3_20540 [Paenibacillus sp. J22TS3]